MLTYCKNEACFLFTTSYSLRTLFWPPTACDSAFLAPAERLLPRRPYVYAAPDEKGSGWGGPEAPVVVLRDGFSQHFDSLGSHGLTPAAPSRHASWGCAHRLPPLLHCSLQ